ncbi:ABC transporter ATP-binding protein [Spirosoma utsteinense]|uniref:Multiple sugar transport system ATP-binding protein n=1 Tax=Spirosoma utsteinense TaxID=2585773 RepID=A0ABR6WB53_9BACT|nr:sn-glycerol-3-phosphate ABC transporter ATP-binding protein UgpC [Spirosoma utsteinense]MBC3786831.1 multiple sugar transport system ATP-binding protein [Spirosoma utsteinense]MBC3793748.1 multiple sugar transport system ATP-binding protein [Spirosoma utsteinense]
MAEVLLKHISKAYAGGPTVIRDISIDVKDREFVVLVGPSGCGKSTLLRMIAGLEDITNGDLLLDGQRINDRAPKDRDIAMVFQNYALYPHMTVYENMAFGLKLRNMPKDEIRQRVTRAAQILEIESLLDRKPKDMSGGQRQRVAIGRAIVRNPKVFLFDEPLSNLDAKLRGQTRIELQKLHRDLQATMIYVTHDQVEAMTLGDRIVVLRNGDVMQHDTPLALYNQPANRFVAGFIGSPPMNFLPGRIVADGTALRFESAGGAVSIRLNGSVHQQALAAYAGRAVELGIRAEHLTDQPMNRQRSYFSPEQLIVFDAVERMGSETLAYFILEGQRFVARLSGDSTVDTSVGVSTFWDIDKAHFFDADTEQTIR